MGELEYEKGGCGSEGGGILHIALFALIRIACFVWVRLGDCGEVMVCHFFRGLAL